MLVRRIPMSEVPEDDEGSALFIHKLYKEKDDIYDVYAREGSFKSLGLKRIDMKLNYYDLYIVAMWALVTLSPAAYLTIYLMSKATLLVNLIIVSLFFIGNFSSIIFF